MRKNVIRGGAVKACQEGAANTTNELTRLQLQMSPPELRSGRNVVPNRCGIVPSQI